MADSTPPRATRTAPPAATSSPRPGGTPRARPGAPSSSPPPPAARGDVAESPPSEGHTDSGSGHLDDSGGSFPGRGPSAAPGQPSGGLVHDLCLQSMEWHAYALMQVLGVGPEDLAQIMYNAADNLGANPTEPK